MRRNAGSRREGLPLAASVMSSFERADFVVVRSEAGTAGA